MIRGLGVSGPGGGPGGTHTIWGGGGSNTKHGTIYIYIHLQPAWKFAWGRKARRPATRVSAEEDYVAEASPTSRPDCG